jgi:hypothetical protein
MATTLEEVLLTVWRQALVENLKVVVVGDDTFTVRSTAKRKLKQVDFTFEGKALRGLEQNPEKTSHWAAMVGKGSRVMQFLEGWTYIGVVFDGKVCRAPR